VTLWTHDLGEGRLLVMERDAAGYQASLVGFCGTGSTQDAALDDLLARIRAYGEASDAFERSLAPGGHLHERLRLIEQLVDQITRRPS
jgi:hypothetical protein